MKILKKKLKKVHFAKRFFYFLSLILYLATFIYFVYGITKLKNIETLLRSIAIAFFAMWFFIYLLCGLLTMLAKKTKTYVFITILTLLFCPLFAGSSYLINNYYGILSGINSEKLTYTTNLIALKETNFTSNSVIGMIESEEDIEGNILAKKLIEKQNLSNKIETYEDYHSMLSDLINGKIAGCFVSSNYAITLEDELEFKENEPGLSDRVKVLFEYSEERANQDAVILQNSSKKTLTEPFTVLIMGVDSAIDGLKANQAFNGDTLILATFNPNTLSATMFSIPRDMYVPIACNHNRYAKINSSAAYGSSCVISTIKQLTDIDIDYYVKINFTGVVELVDALGGVTVDVEEPDFQFNRKYDCKGMICEQNSLRQFGNNMIYVPVGKNQHLNGEQALAYSRNRHQFAVSDIARNQHQQQVIEAMAQELKHINSISEFENILNTVSRNIETNMTPEQILSFYSVGKDMLINSSGNSLSIQKTYLSYYSLPVYLPRSGQYTSALGYYPESLEAIKKLMKVNLELESETPVKSYKISYNENYTTPVVGKGLTGGAKLERVKGFIGNTQYDANVWCQQVGISCSFETIPGYQTAGTIIDQSAHEGELVKSLNKITFKLSDGSQQGPISQPEDPEPEPEPKPEPDPNEEDPNNPVITNPDPEPDPNENEEEPEIPGGPDE